MEEPPSMAIKMDEASNTNSEENNESSSDGTMVSKVWISRQLVNHWFLNTVSLIFVRFTCLLFIICITIMTLTCIYVNIYIYVFQPLTSPYEDTENRMSMSKPTAETEIIAMPLKKEIKSDQEEEEEESDVEIRLMSRPTSNAAWIASIRADIQSLLKHYRQRVLDKL